MWADEMIRVTRDNLDRATEALLTAAAQCTDDAGRKFAAPDWDRSATALAEALVKHAVTVLRGRPYSACEASDIQHVRLGKDGVPV